MRDYTYRYRFKQKAAPAGSSSVFDSFSRFIFVPHFSCLLDLYKVEAPGKSDVVLVNVAYILNRLRPDMMCR